MESAWKSEWIIGVIYLSELPAWFIGVIYFLTLPAVPLRFSNSWRKSQGFSTPYSEWCTLPHYFPGPAYSFLEFDQSADSLADQPCRLAHKFPVFWPPRRCLAFINLIISQVPLTFSMTPPSSTPLFPRFRKQLFPRPPSKSRMSFSLRFFHSFLDSWPKTPRIYLKIDHTTPFFPPASPHKFKHSTLFGIDFW